MAIQLRLPHLHHWLMRRHDPQLQLDQLYADMREAKAEVRDVLERLAKKHGITAKDIDYAMGYADDMLSDVVYEVETGLKREIEGLNPV